MADDFDVDEFLDGYKPRIEVARVCTRADLLAEHQRLDEAINGDTDDPKMLLDLQERIDALETEIGKATRVFTFQSVTAEKWANLMRAHPPTKEQLEQKPGLDNNPDEFWPVAIEACAVSPKVTATQARKMRDKLRPADWETVIDAVLVANQAVMLTPKSEMATVIRHLRDASSTTPRRTGSRRRSSSAGNGGRSRSTTTTAKAG